MSLSLLLIYPSFLFLYSIRYATVYGPLDWVSIKLRGPPPGPDGDNTTEMQTERFGREDDALIDQELAALHGINDEDEEERAVTAPANRIEELNATLQALGGEICGILQPSADKVLKCTRIMYQTGQD